MTLDRKRLRDKLEQLKNPGARRSRPVWKPDKEGEESTVRLVEYPYGDDPFVELWFHYGIGEGPNANFLCPRLNYKKSCPVCDFVKESLNFDDPADKDLGKKMFAKQRIHAVVVDRADSTNTPKFWGFGKRVYQTLLETLVDEDYGNYLDPHEGLDVKVKYQKAQGQSFPSTTLKFARKESPLADTDAEVQQILSKIPKYEDIYEQLTKEEIKIQLTNWLSVENNDDVDPESVSKELTKVGEDAPTESVGGNSVEDIDAAFESALG